MNEAGATMKEQHLLIKKNECLEWLSHFCEVLMYSIKSEQNLRYILHTLCGSGKTVCMNCIV